MENIISLPPPSVVASAPPPPPCTTTTQQHQQLHRHHNRRHCIHHAMEALVGSKRLLRKITPVNRRSRNSYLADGFNEGPTVPTEVALADKDLVLLYFSGGWCASCREFTSLLIEFYFLAAELHYNHNEDQEEGEGEEDNKNPTSNAGSPQQQQPGARTKRSSMKKDSSSSLSTKIEVVYVSADRDVGEFEDYYSRMPWLAVDFHSSHCKTMLTRKCHIGRIPTVVVLDAKTGYYVTDRGCEEIRHAMLHTTTGSSGSIRAAVESLIEKWQTAEAVPLNQATFSKGACIIL